MAQDDFSPLMGSLHMLYWMGRDPLSTLRGWIESLLQEQDPGTVLEAVRVTADPRYLSGGRQVAEGKVILTRMGFAFAFEIEVTDSQKRPWTLTGVTTIVAAGLDKPGETRYQFYFELDGELEEFSSPEVMGVSMQEIDQAG